MCFTSNLLLLVIIVLLYLVMLINFPYLLNHIGIQGSWTKLIGPTYNSLHKLSFFYLKKMVIIQKLGFMFVKICEPNNIAVM